MLAMHLALIKINQKNKLFKYKNNGKKKLKENIQEIINILIPFRF